MGTKFVIFLAFASLVQSCYGSTLKVSFGLSEDEVDILEEIVNNEKTSVIAAFDAYNTIFDIIVGLGSETQDDCSEVSEVLTNLNAAIDPIFDSITLLLGDSSSADVEVVRNTSYLYLDDVSDQMTSALNLAESGNYSENQADIENYQAAALTDYTALNEMVWNLISNDSNYQDADVQAVIKSAANESLVGLRYANSAAFNAIKLVAVAVDAECGQYKTIKSEIEELRGKALAGLKRNLEYGYSTLATLYINSQLSLTGVVSGSAVIAYAQTVSQARYAEGNVVLFDELKRHLSEILYNFSDDGEADFSQDDLDLQTVITLFDVGDHIILDSFLALYPTATSAIATTRNSIHTLNVAGDVAFNDAILTSVTAGTNGTNYTEILEEIATLRHAAVDPAPEYTDIFFDLIRNNKTFDDDVETELVYLQNLTTYGAQVATNKFLDGVIILANASYTGEVTDDTFSAIDTLLDEAIDGLQYFTQGLAAASFLVLQVITAS